MKNKQELSPEMEIVVQKKMWSRVAGVAAIILIGSCVYAGYQKQQAREGRSETIFAMDTVMELTIYGAGAEEAVDAAREEIDRLDALLSTGSEESEVSLLNASGGGTASEDVGVLLESALEMQRLTGGAFNVAVYQVMKAWGFTDGNYQVPDAASLAALVEALQAGSIDYDEASQRVTLSAGTELDFGGIAKGYTGERLVTLLTDMGITSAVLSLGGNVQTIGYKADGSMWRVAVKDPENTSSYVGVVEVADKAVITSGGYERYFEEDGVTYHHIIDPATGYPAESNLASVTIVSSHGTIADALSTALYVMGRESAITFWRENGTALDFEMILIDTDGTIYVSDGIAGQFSSDRTYTVIE